MVISSEEFCCFSISGRLRLLQQYGTLEFEMITTTREMAVFQMCGFHVMVTRNLNEGGKVSVEPVLQRDLLPLFLLP